MTETLTTPASEDSRGKSLLALIPGLLLLVVGYAGKFIEQSLTHSPESPSAAGF